MYANMRRVVSCGSFWAPTRMFGAGGEMHGTTILCVRRGGKVCMIGDGQVSMGNIVVKGNAKKVRRIGDDILVGFAGSTADAFTLLERLEAKLEEHPDQLTRACVDLAKAWRTDKYLRRLEAILLVADKNATYELTGNGDVLEPTDGLLGIGSGGAYALAAARALATARGRATDRSSRSRRCVREIVPLPRSTIYLRSRSRVVPWMSPRTCAVAGAPFLAPRRRGWWLRRTPKAEPASQVRIHQQELPCRGTGRRGANAF